ncbi:P63C domain-containing protein [Myxococcus sp. AS-1-15]|uniref:P63C domain-containing protein n=1 Tax=Myxococcus sp. AS-1-15 TaxID=2874600 RepID=UPI001CBC3255|nr:P63C domain-containing protein [Myxococcus sp. AS-1-15]MBZ4402411.1 hypothetical protein [Myxococcus sp. AS-1-15]
MSKCSPGSSPVVFEFEAQKVRTVTGPNGEPWFVAADVCTALGLRNGRDAVARLSMDERNTVVIGDGNRGNPNQTVISEPGVYRLIFTSRVEKAEDFKRWLAHDVLPSIRKTGAFVVPMPVVREAVAKLFVRRTLGDWVKRFPDEFYWHIYRLRGWTWRNMEVNHPQVVARYTIDIMYERIAPGLLVELEKKNPRNGQGRRKNRHHQFLTDEIGHPALAQHMYSVLILMRASQTWDQFMLALDRFHPKQGRNLLLSLVDDLLPPPSAGGFQSGPTIRFLTR